MRYLTFFQTWSFPGDSNWDYICFTAKSKKEAEKIGQEWINWKIDKLGCEFPGGELVSKTESQKWKHRDGSPVFSEIEGIMSFREYRNLLDYQSKTTI